MLVNSNSNVCAEFIVQNCALEKNTPISLIQLDGDLYAFAESGKKSYFSLSNFLFKK